MATTQPPRLLLATAIAYGGLAVGHTMKGLGQFDHASLKQVPLWLRSAAKTGWYEGSVFFTIMGLLNYKWSQTGVMDGVDKTIVGLITTMLFGAGATYWKSGDRPTGGILFVVGVLQGLGLKAVL